MSDLGKSERETQNSAIELFHYELDYCYLGDWTDRDGNSNINPLLANAFFRAGYIEAWGRGIEKIYRVCREHDMEQPLYDFGMSGLMLTFLANPAHLPATAVEHEAATTPKTTQEKILALLHAQPSITRRELAERIGLSDDGIKYHLDKLRAADVIRHVGPTKTGHWEILK